MLKLQNMRAKLIILLLLLPLTYCSKNESNPGNETNDYIICKINKEEYRISDFTNFLKERGIIDTDSIPNRNEFLANYLDIFIERKILEKNLEKENIKLDPNELQSFETMDLKDKNADIERNKENLLLQKYLVLKLIPKLKISEEEIKKYYEENKSKFIMGKRIKIAQILFATKEDADELYSKLLKKPDLFKELFNKKGLDDIQSKGAFIITYQKGELPRDLEELVWSTPINGITKPFAIPDGDYIIFKILDKKEEGIASYDEIKNNIEKKLALIKIEQLNQLFKEELRKNNKVIIYQNNLNFIYSGKYDTNL